MPDLGHAPTSFLGGDIRLWVIVPLILMIPLNLGFWFAYVEGQHATSTNVEPKVPTLWGYFESDTFKGITASLVIPIVIFLIESRFKILENFEATRNEKISQLRNNNREKRWEAIKDTKIMWNELFELTSEVSFFEKSVDGKLRIKELLKKINNSSIKQSTVINDWDTRFPNISREDITTLVNLVGPLWQATFTVAFFIEDDIDKENPDIHDLQFSLRIIQEGYRNSFYNFTLNILQRSIRLLEIIEDGIDEHEVNPFTEDVDKEIDKLSDKMDEKNSISLRQTAYNVKKEISDMIKKVKQTERDIFNTNQKAWKLLPNVDEQNENDEIKKYYDEYVKSGDILKSKSFQEYLEMEEWGRFFTAHNSIPRKLHVESYRYDYTQQGIKNLADYFILRYRIIQLNSIKAS